MRAEAGQTIPIPAEIYGRLASKSPLRFDRPTAIIGGRLR